MCCRGENMKFEKIPSWQLPMYKSNMHADNPEKQTACKCRHDQYPPMILNPDSMWWRSIFQNHCSRKLDYWPAIIHQPITNGLENIWLCALTSDNLPKHRHDRFTHFVDAVGYENDKSPFESWDNFKNDSPFTIVARLFFLPAKMYTL